MKQINKSIEEEAGVLGEIFRFKLAEWVQEDSEILDVLREYTKTGEEHLLEMLKEVGALKKHSYHRNIIATEGFAVLTERLVGGTTYSGEINYGALGNGGSVSPAVGDTQLDNEVYRKQPGSQTFNDAVSYVDFFYSASDTDGTYTEFGNVIDGQASANTGQLWSHIAVSWTKTSNESMFVSCKYTLSNKTP